MTTATEPSQLGAWLRRERERRLWTRAEMSRQLIKAAEANGDYGMPGVNDIIHNLYRWERGKVTPGERYRLYYCHAFGLTPDLFSVERAEPGATLMELKAGVTLIIRLRDSGAELLLIPDEDASREDYVPPSLE